LVCSILTYCLAKFLVISPESTEMTCKTGQMSISASVRCQHLQNSTAPRDCWAKVDETNTYILCWMFNFGPCATWERWTTPTTGDQGAYVYTITTSAL